MNILVVDDEKEIADVIALYLQNDEYQVHKFYAGEEALNCIETTKIDLALLDVMLPDIDGFEILKRIREKYTFPVIMLTAKVDYMDKITGLTLGADDYIPKPFNPLELVARVKAQLRRYTQYNDGGKIEGDVEIVAYLQHVALVAVGQWTESAVLWSYGVAGRLLLLCLFCSLLSCRLGCSVCRLLCLVLLYLIICILIIHVFSSTYCFTNAVKSANIWSLRSMVHLRNFPKILARSFCFLVSAILSLITSSAGSLKPVLLPSS